MSKNDLALFSRLELFADFFRFAILGDTTRSTKEVELSWFRSAGLKYLYLLQCYYRQEVCLHSIREDETLYEREV